jgi:NhaA family Na+:H+ antiporter
MAGVGALAGIGFTMSLFVANLGLEPDQLPAGKLGTLAGSLVSAVAGALVLRWALKKENRRAMAAEGGS